MWEGADETATDIGENGQISQYLKEIGSYPLLEPQQEQELARQMQQGLVAQKEYDQLKTELADDRKQQLLDVIKAAKTAKEKMVTSNLRLVVSIAKKYVGCGLELLDLIQEGNIGLTVAIEKFNSKYNCKVSTYATWWIRQFILRALSNQARTVRLPEYKIQKIRKLLNTQEQNHARGDEDMQRTLEELNISLTEAEELLQCSQPVVSLDVPIGEDEESCVGDFIADSNEMDPLKALQNNISKEVLIQALDKLTPREKEVIIMRYGICDGTVQTLRDIGRYVNVSSEMVRQIEKMALAKLRNASCSEELKIALEGF